MATQVNLQEAKAVLKKLRDDRSTDFEFTAAKYLGEAKKSGNKELELLIQFQRCVYQNHVLSNYKESIELANTCLTLAQQLNDYTHCADAYRMIGVNNNYIGELAKARDAYESGIKILEAREQLSHEDKVILAGLYFNTVTLYKEFDLDTLRLQYIDKAFELFNETNNKQGIARCYLSYANNYPGIKGTDKALDYYHKAADMFREIKDKRGEGNCLINIGYQLCQREKFDEGIIQIEKGIAYLQEAGSAVFVTNGYFQLGIGYRLKGDYKLAVEQFRKVQHTIETTNARFSMASLYEEWALALEQNEQYAEALQMYKRHYKEMEAMYKFDKNSAVSDARMSFELEERKREAEVLKRKNEEIEEYTHRLEVSNAELKQFAHIASHDLKEPLRMVTLYMQLLEKQSAQRLSSDSLQYLYYAKEGANRMYNLVESILSLSKINPDIKREVVDLNKVLYEVQEFLQPEMLQQGFRVSSVALPRVKANRHQMVQLFQNLINNAIKFSINENPCLDISCKQENGFYCFSFIDNGIGIQQQYRQKVFDIFQRLHTRDKYSGTGIGLTICKKIIEHHNGKIWIEDGQEGGCCFKFTLPLQT